MSLFELLGIYFHDLPINSLVFDFDNEVVELIISIYDEKDDNYQIKGLLFEASFDICIDGNLTLFDNSYRIHGDMDEISYFNNGFAVNLDFIQGHSSFTLKLKCKNIIIINKGISDK